MENCEDIFPNENENSSVSIAHQKNNQLLDNYIKTLANSKQSVGPTTSKICINRRDIPQEIGYQIKELSNNIIELKKCVTEMQNFQSQTFKSMKEEMKTISKDFYEFLNMYKSSKKRTDFPSEVIFENGKGEKVNLLKFDGSTEKKFISLVMKDIFSQHEIRTSIIKSKNSTSLRENEFDPKRIEKLKGKKIEKFVNEDKKLTINLCYLFKKLSWQNFVYIQMKKQRFSKK